MKQQIIIGVFYNDTLISEQSFSSWDEASVYCANLNPIYITKLLN
jgi:hypothetical protein